MFKVDEYVVYGTAGVCLVKDIRKENFGGRKAEYYILQPIFDRDSMIYAPVDNEKVTIRSVIGEEELYSLIHELPERKPAWIENDKLRSETFKETLRTGDIRSIFFMLHDLYLHKFAQAEKGRKLHIADDNIMRSAENLVNSEFAHVLGIEPADVVPFILREAFPEK